MREGGGRERERELRSKVIQLSSACCSQLNGKIIQTIADKGEKCLIYLSEFSSLNTDDCKEEVTSLYITILL